jgi:phospholipase C
MRSFGIVVVSFVVASVPFLSCSSNSSKTSASSDDADTRPPTPPEWDRQVTRPDDATANANRAACKYARGAMPAETLGTSTPVDKDIPIETVVVLVQENHSFDNYFGHLNKYSGRNDIESAPDTATNPDKAGGSTGSHAYSHASHPCNLDVNHEWHGSHVEYDDGKMDGFFEANDGNGSLPPGNQDASLLSGERAMWWYDERDIPFYYKLASTFAIADHYHSALLGPTWPNRMYVYSGTSFGMTDNNFPDLTGYTFPDKDASVLDELEKRHVDWLLYTDGAASAGVVHGPAAANRWNGRRVTASMATFTQAAAAGTLPAVSFVDANNLAEDNIKDDDEHPPGDIQVGQKFVSDLVHALFKSPQWSKMALFVTYDEHGGYYDHVAPAAACPPDAIAPILNQGDTTKGAFDRYGVRVPFILVSPYAKKGYVGHTTYDHTSITRFIEAKFKIPALTARDANADPLMDLFDFSNPAFATPPDIPDPSIDAAGLTYCTGLQTK